MDAITNITWMVVLIVAPIAFVVGLVAMLVLMERDLKIAEKRWERLNVSSRAE